MIFSGVGGVPTSETLFSGNYANSRLEGISGVGKGDVKGGGDEFWAYRGMITLGNFVTDQIGYLFYQIIVAEGIGC